MSNHSLSNLKEATKELIKETSGGSSSFLFQVENLLGRYMRSDKELADELRKVADDILNAYHQSGVEGVNAMDKDAYGEELRPLLNWLRGKIRGDITNKRELPQNVDAEYASAESKTKAYFVAKEKAAEAARAKIDAEKQRRDALTPEERQKEDDWNMTLAVYGGIDNYRRGRGLGT